MRKSKAICGLNTARKRNSSVGFYQLGENQEQGFQTIYCCTCLVFWKRHHIRSEDLNKLKWIFAQFFQFSEKSSTINRDLIDNDDNFSVAVPLRLSGHLVLSMSPSSSRNLFILMSLKSAEAEHVSSLDSSCGGQLTSNTAHQLSHLLLL